MKAKWIWINGDFEIYHSIKLHSRRKEGDYSYPAFWQLSSPSPNAYFLKEFTAPEPFSFKVIAKGSGKVDIDNDPFKRFPFGKEILLEAGKHTVKITAMNIGAFPAVFIDSEYLKTDESWIASPVCFGKESAGCTDLLSNEDDDPLTFPFSYKKIEPMITEETNGGTLLDFGFESFCRLKITTEHADQKLELFYGESREEALDTEFAHLKEFLCGKRKYILSAAAFRYIFVKTDGRYTLSAEYEYLPQKDVAKFDCGSERIKKIWEAASRTFHLCSRELFIDGIKRDRWAWSGDAYQSYMINNYLFFDTEITKRTIIALLGKPSYREHINRINDYSMFLIIGAAEYYEATGDRKFILDFYIRFKALFDFITSRLDENGYVVEREGDWIFIDWSEMDKSGPLCAEQILLWRAYKAMACLSELCGADGEKYNRDAEKLKKSIIRDYWREDKGAFIDCHTSGLEHISRHPNILAVLFDLVPKSKVKKIIHNVFENDKITQITTPYFEFFELCARCKTGNIEFAQDKIDSYWGGMIDLGATTIWEAFDPKDEGLQHYKMYEYKYDKSLCHAWGAGPIYLLGRYCLGVRSTSVGYKTFEVEPFLGKYPFVKGTVPLPEGKKITVFYDGKTAWAKTDADGGTLIIDGKRYTLEKNKKLTVKG